VEEISDDIRARVREIEAGAGEALGIRPAAMTITNLGASPIESFCRHHQSPEVAILAIGKNRALCPSFGTSQVAIQDRVALTLSADHRIINGKYAADFLGAIIREIESF